MCQHCKPVLSLCLSMFLFTSCASIQAKPATSNTPVTGETADHAETTIGEKAADAAVSMIGRPYKYRGNSPEGFDCSGLVQYSYLVAGMEDVPHGTKALRKRTRAIDTDMQTGDLLFFTERGKKYSHVGIYLENDTFVHAPSTGGHVRKESLQDPYYKDHFDDARRFP